MKRFLFFLILLSLNFYRGQAESCDRPGKTTAAVLKTDAGEMTVLLSNRTPVHRDNFVKLARSGFYDGMLFHRVIRGFVIQAGDPESRKARPGIAYGEGGAEHRLEPEIVPGLHHIRGMVGAAREGDAENPDRLSSGSHFYIVLGRGKPVTETVLQRMEERLGGTVDPAVRQSYLRDGGVPHLDGAYTLFGYVAAGMETADAIAAEPTDGNDRPRKDVRIISIKIKKIKNTKLKELCNPELKNF